jgi:alanine racemase
VAGNVTMDQILVDCGDDSVARGDEVVLIGHGDDDEISADELADLMGTNSYEVVTSIGQRVPRVYVNERPAGESAGAAAALASGGRQGRPEQS